MSMRERWERLWEAQRSYNDMVKSVQTDKPDWNEVYLLGLVGEVDEILRELKWKRQHAGRGISINRDNLADELADATKFILSLWQENGFTIEDMLTAVEIKTSVLEHRLRWEFFPPTSKHVIITDLDGTVANYRKGFNLWLGHEHEHDIVRSLNGDLDQGMDWLQYNGLKEEFESSGGYATLPVYADAADLLTRETLRGTTVIVFTARPVSQFQRIRYDTHAWLRLFEIPADHVLFGREERLLALAKLAQNNNTVLLLEDDPVNAMRAANSGFKVYLKDQPYNQEVSHENISRHIEFPTRVNWGGQFHSAGQTDDTVPTIEGVSSRRIR